MGVASPQMFRWTQQLLAFACCMAVLCSSAFSGVVLCEASDGHHAIELAHQPGGCADRSASTDAPEGCQDRALGGDLVRCVTKATVVALQPFFAVLGVVTHTPVAQEFCSTRSEPSPGVGKDNHLNTIILLI